MASVIADTFSCAIDECFADMRETRMITTQAEKCVECGMEIPAGEVFMLCEGTYDEEWEGRERLWEQMPQHLECYRFCRKLNHENGACPPFGGLEDCLDGLWPELKWPILKWQSLKAQIKRRLAKGIGPWESWDSLGNWQPDLLYGNRFPKRTILGLAKQPPKDEEGR